MEDRIKDIEDKISLMISYLKMRVKMADWHGVMDAAADIRELEAELRVLKNLK